MIEGSCLCGRVRYEIEKAELISHCHCSMCRKAHGAAYASFASVLPQNFRFTGGEDHVVSFQSAPDNVRTFCDTCGSNLPKLNRSGTSIVVPVGGLDDDPLVRPAFHMFVGSKASWHEIEDDLPRFDEWVPGFEPNQR